MLTRIALQVLCTMWPDGAAYAPKVDEFALGMVGDFDDEVRQAALSILGEQLRVTPDPRRFAILVDAATDPLVGEVTAACAVSAAARALGDDWNAIPSVGAQLRDAEWARDVLTRALELVVGPDGNDPASG